jgi:hypothetical protein
MNEFFLKSISRVFFIIVDHPMQSARTKILSNPFFCSHKLLYFFIYNAKVYNPHIRPCKPSSPSKYSCLQLEMHLNSVTPFKTFWDFSLTQHIYFDNILRYKYRRRSVTDEWLKDDVTHGKMLPL